MANKIRLKQLDVSLSLPPGIVSSSAQLDGSTFKNITISTENSDKYSLIVSGAVGIVGASNVSASANSGTTVNPQIYMVSGSVAPSDPMISGESQSNIIDLGEY
jgi:hypothetical protein